MRSVRTQCTVAMSLCLYTLCHTVYSLSKQSSNLTKLTRSRWPWHPPTQECKDCSAPSYVAALVTVTTTFFEHAEISRPKPLELSCFVEGVSQRLRKTIPMFPFYIFSDELLFRSRRFQLVLCCVVSLLILHSSLLTSPAFCRPQSNVESGHRTAAQQHSRASQQHSRASQQRSRASEHHSSATQQSSSTAELHLQWRTWTPTQRRPGTTTYPPSQNSSSCLH
jgi:hypothetical protein